MLCSGQSESRPQSNPESVAGHEKLLFIKEKRKPICAHKLMNQAVDFLINVHELTEHNI